MYNSQEVANIIKALAKSQKKPIGKMLSACNLSINTLSSMQSGGYYPRLEAITKIADYLNCSVDYLLGRTDFSNTETSDEEKLINNFRSLNEEGQNFIIQTMDFAQTKYGNKPSQENISSSDYAEIAAEGGSITRGPIRKKPETTL